MFEICNHFLHLGFAFSVKLSYLIFFDFSPVSVLAILILFKELVELSEQIGIDVSEQPSHDFNSGLMDVSLQAFNEVINFVLIAPESI
jgi:hypothetical protein